MLGRLTKQQCRDYGEGEDEHLDHYEEEGLDRATYAPMSVEQRALAEKALAERDWREGRRAPALLDFGLPANRMPKALRRRAAARTDGSSEDSVRSCVVFIVFVILCFDSPKKYLTVFWPVMVA